MPSHETSIYSESTLRLLTLAASTAAFAGVGIALLQLDGVSRKILSPEKLRIKRRATAQYHIEKAIANASNDLMCAAGGGHNLYDPEEDRAMTSLLTTDDEIESLVNEIIGEKDSSKAPFVVSIELDDEDPRAQREYYLFLAFPKEGSKRYRRMQVPLVRFCTKLADAFEKKLTSTALCFVADASSGLGAEVLGKVLSECGAGLALVREPAWMVTVAYMIQKNVISKSKMERVLFALCRLDANRVRDDVGASRTVVFTLPGQSCTPPLLPLLQKAFPCERHVFAYDTCAESLCRGLNLSSGRKKKRIADKESISSELLSAPSDLMARVPIAPLRSLRDLPPLLATFSEDQANIIESWMSSVNAFLLMKQNENENEYLPFVCRMGFLLGRTGLGDGYTDQSDIALQNVLQYITGSRSRPLKDEVLDAARVALADARKVCEVFPRAEKQMTEQEQNQLEECVFCHKQILIGNKTLIDTVQPAKEWSLKSARKLTGCACCGPEDEYDSDDDKIGQETSADKDSGGLKMNGIDLSVPGAGFATGLTQRKKPAFVDGKTQFAFDPTKFS
uniref:Transmembrane protein n=2 Tax=Ditylum brightwellii TaxID=49249 RepID=A0A6V2E689_9STRA